MTAKECEDCPIVKGKDLAIVSQLKAYRKVMIHQEDEIKGLKHQVLEFENKWEEARLKLAELERLPDATGREAIKG